MRSYFVHQNQYFERDVFDGHHKGLDVFKDHYEDRALLEIELMEEDDEVIIPPFVQVIKEVTDDPAFSNRSLASV